METQLDIVCKMQRNEKVSPVWCDQAQYRQLCSGCAHSVGRKKSRHQQASKKEEK